jgi:hypothetical protein
MSDKPELGQICYEAFCEVFSGPDCVKWENLDSLNQEAWQRAAKAVITYTS